MSGDAAAEDRPRRTRGPVSRRRWLWGLAGIAVFVAIVEVVLVFRSMGVVGESDDAPTVSQIETYTGVRLPPGARDLEARLQLVITKRTVMARFTIDPGELPAMVKGSPFQELRSSPTPPDQLEVPDAPSWWTPHRARSFLTATAHHAAILVDTGRTDRYVVYLIARS